MNFRNLAKSERQTTLADVPPGSVVFFDAGDSHQHIRLADELGRATLFHVGDLCTWNVPSSDPVAWFFPPERVHLIVGPTEAELDAALAHERPSSRHDEEVEGLKRENRRLLDALDCERKLRLYQAPQVSVAINSAQIDSKPTAPHGHAKKPDWVEMPLRLSGTRVESSEGSVVCSVHYTASAEAVAAALNAAWAEPDDGQLVAFIVRAQALGLTAYGIMPVAAMILPRDRDIMLGEWYRLGGWAGLAAKRAKASKGESE